MRPLCGVPVLGHALLAARLISNDITLVDDSDDEAFRLFVDASGPIRRVLQPRQEKPDALRRQLSSIAPDDMIVLIRADCPLLTPGDLAKLSSSRPLQPRVLGYSGRGGAAVSAAAGHLCRILSHEEIDERVDVVDYVCLRAIEDGAECIEMTESQSAARAAELVGLYEAEFALYRRIAQRWRKQDVRVGSDALIDITASVEAGAFIGNRVELRGATNVGRNARVDTGSILTDVTVAADAWIKPYTLASQSTIGAAAHVGPFANLRAHTELEAETRIGNFVETTRIVVRRGAMANHLAYLGDGDIGERSNMGAGTIFCNSDGVNKHRTVVGNGAFVGSDCQLVAPVNVGARAFVATGTTVTSDVPDDALAIARVPQINKEGYAIKLRERFASTAKARQK